MNISKTANTKCLIKSMFIDQIYPNQHSKVANTNCLLYSRSNCEKNECIFVK